MTQRKLSESGENDVRRDGLRKFSIGVASVLLSSTLVASHAGQAHAATAEGTETSSDDNTSQSNASNTVTTKSGLVVSNSSSAAQPSTDQSASSESTSKSTQKAEDSTASNDQSSTTSNDNSSTLTAFLVSSGSSAETKAKMAAAVSKLVAAPAATSTSLSSNYYKTTTENKDVNRTVNYKTTDGSKAPDSKTDKLTYTKTTITGNLSSLTSRAANDGLTVNKGESKTYATKDEALSDLSKQVDDLQKALGNYESAKAGYDIAMKSYAADLKKWEDAQNNPHTVKGISQSLTFNNEKDANISISSPTGKQIDYIKSSAWLGSDSKGVYAMENVGKSYGDNQITANVSEATSADTSQWGKTYTGIRMKVGDSFLATYTNLRNSTYIDSNGNPHAIGKATIKYTLNSTTSNDGTANVFVSSNPNIAFWYGAKNDNNGSVEFSLELTLYDKNGSKINNMSNAWLSMSSLNNGSLGTEYFNPGSNQAAMIPGSSVIKHNDGSYYSDNDNSAEKAGFDWDSPSSENRYYGAAVMQANGSSFKVGTKAKEGSDTYVWFALDTNLATAYKPLQPTAPTKPTVSYHDVTASYWDGPKDFTDVATPPLTGYKADKSVVSNKNIAHDHPDIVETVTYTPDIQKGAVTYIDDNTGKTLKTDNLTGKSNAKSGYTTKSSIADYQSKGYKLVSDSTNGQEIVYDNNASVDQNYTVHLKHDTKTPAENKHNATVTRTITYKMSDGSKAPASVKDSLTFTAQDTVDAVTGTVLSTAWSGNQDFKDVASPAVKGYTVDRKVVSNKNIAHDHANIEEVVTYTPEDQKAKVVYIDQTTGKTLKTENLAGKTNAKSGYTTGKSIKDYEDNGYVLVSDSSNGQELVFDDDTSKDQEITVILKHSYATVTEENPGKPGEAVNANPDGTKWPDGTDKGSLGDDVVRTITYRMSDGSQAPGPVDSILHFTAQKTIDKVTGEIISTTWSPTQDFDDITSPDVKGYTPDQKVVSDKGITHEHSDIHVIVTYDPDPQKAKVTYVDEKTGKTLSVKDLTGKSNGKSGYTTAEEIAALEGMGYKLISDDTNGQEVVFDDDSSVDQSYVVTLTHRIDNSEEKNTMTRTIRLHTPDGLKTIKQVGHSTRSVATDAVTGEKTYGEWSKDKWDEFDTPEIKGYTASLDKVLKEIIDGDTKDKTVDIYYKKKESPAPQKDTAKPASPVKQETQAQPAPAASLPKTGNESSILMQSAGMFATGASLLATIADRKKQNKQEKK